jgi:hypothetical protein
VIIVCHVVLLLFLLPMFSLLFVFTAADLNSVFLFVFINDCFVIMYDRVFFTADHF